MNNITFRHKVKLNDGTYTNGSLDLELHLSLDTYLFDDMDFKDKSVLDVGCWDGGHSFAAEKKGANRIVSLDKPSTRWGGTEGYKFLHDHFKSKCEFIEGDVYNLKERFGSQEFDIVLCYGILYHLSDPLLALKNLFHVCKTTINFEGVFSTSEIPVLELRKHTITKDFDPTYIYIPSISYMVEIAQYFGFSLRKTSTAYGDRI
jgi:tRNA (mo5U34)-methyltransferase